MFGELITNRSCFIKDGYDAINKLKTKLSHTTNNNKKDELEMSINKIFGNDEECETGDLDTIEVITDDYNGYNPISIDDEDKNEDKITTSHSNICEVSQSHISTKE